MKERERILIFNVNWLGDVLFSTAAIRNIRMNYPRSYIACIIPPRCLPVLEGNPALDEIIVFDEKQKHKSILAKIGFIAYLRRKKFDIAFLLHRSFSRALICRLAGIPRRAGYYTPKRGFLLTDAFVPPPVESVHRIDYYLEVIKQSGLEIRDRHTEFFAGPDDIAAVDNFLVNNSLKNAGFLAGINPGGNWVPKRWPADNFAVLADKLADEFKAKIIITGSAQDAGLAEEIRRKMSHEAVIACGKLTIKQFAVLTRSLNVFISADSGPLHIANASGAKKIIAIFGPTDPRLTGPYPADNAVIVRKDSGCRIPCYRADCPDNRCMKMVTPGDVFAAVVNVLKTGTG